MFHTESIENVFRKEIIVELDNVVSREVDTADVDKGSKGIGGKTGNFGVTEGQNAQLGEGGSAQGRGIRLQRITVQQ